MKRFLKLIAATACNLSGTTRRLGKTKRLARPPFADITVLMYHRVLPRLTDEYLAGTEDAIAVTENSFREQMAWLSRNGTVLSLAEMLDHLEAGSDFPQRSVVLTFDDGWRDNLTFAAPIIDEFRFPMTVYLSTDHIGTNKLFWFQQVGVLQDRCGLAPEWFTKTAQHVGATPAGTPISPQKHHVIRWMKQFRPGTIDGLIEHMAKEAGGTASEWIPEPQMLSWEDVKQLQDMGIEIGAHGCSHSILTNLSSDEVVREITASKGVIEEKLGCRVDAFAYPNGDYNEQVAHVAKRAGFRSAMATSIDFGLSRTAAQFGIIRKGVHDGAWSGPGGGFSAQLFRFAVDGP